MIPNYKKQNSVKKKANSEYKSTVAHSLNNRVRKLGLFGSIGCDGGGFASKRNADNKSGYAGMMKKIKIMEEGK